MQKTVKNVIDDWHALCETNANERSRRSPKMHFQMAWSDEDKKILLVTSSGLWNAMDTASQWNEVLTLAPKYIIWDVMNTIITPEAYTRPEQDPERQTAFSNLANFLQQAEFKQFYIVTITDHPIFDTARHNAEVYGIAGKLQLVSSVATALKKIQGV